ncbi:hypothetical protein [Parafilimonas sp.]|uniref:hypothetical protein n=1 Tax=Parafilimonas sp. TaxID=1969739 RepID=UPI0039E48CEE
MEIDEAFFARQLSDIIPNPWIAFDLGKQALQLLSEKYDKETIAANAPAIFGNTKAKDIQRNYRHSHPTRFNIHSINNHLKQDA